MLEITYPEPELLDLRPLTRNSDKCRTTIEVQSGMSWTSNRSHWIVLGEVHLSRNREGDPWRLRAYLEGATDFEHDSAYILDIELTGVEFESVTYHTTVLTGHIAMDRELNVPATTDDPRKLEETFVCDHEHCVGAHKHVIVPEDHYVPSHNAELFKVMRGRKVWIRIGPTPDPKDEG